MEQLERRKDQMIQALWSNSNYDDDKGTRKQAIEQLEQQYEETIRTIISGPSEIIEEEEISDDNPFFAPTKEAMRRLDGISSVSSGTVRDALATEEQDYGKHVDQ